MEIAYGVLVGTFLVSTIIAFLAYRKYKVSKESPVKEVRPEEINLFEDLNNINLFVRKNITDEKILKEIEGLIDSSAELYDEVLKLNNNQLVLGPKFQLERTIREHLGVYIENFVDAEDADKGEFINGLRQIKSDIDSTYKIIKSDKLNKFEKNHTFISIKY